MDMNTLPLARFGLLTVEEAALRKGVSDEAVRLWIRNERIPVVVVGEGRNSKYLVPVADLDAFTPAPRGRPVMAKEPPKKSRKKSRNS